MVLLAVKPLAVSYMICGFRRLTIAEGEVRDEKVEMRDGRKLGTGVAMSRTEQ